LPEVGKETAEILEATIDIAFDTPVEEVLALIVPLLSLS
jgi:hypothetical protein